MARGLVRRAEKVGETESWFARVEVEGEETTDLAKTEYDAAGYRPAFWELPKMLRSYSEVVSQGRSAFAKIFRNASHRFAWIQKD